MCLRTWYKGSCSSCSCRCCSASCLSPLCTWRSVGAFSHQIPAHRAADDVPCPLHGCTSPPLRCSCRNAIGSPNAPQSRIPAVPSDFVLARLLAEGALYQLSLWHAPNTANGVSALPTAVLSHAWRVQGMVGMAGGGSATRGGRGLLYPATAASPPPHVQQRCALCTAAS